MKEILLITLILSIIFIAGCIEPVGCTLEAKICPDGSAVGRVPPDCEFAPCPTNESNITKDFNDYDRSTFFPSKVNTDFTEQDFLETQNELCSQIYGYFAENNILEYEFTYLEPETNIYYIPCFQSPAGMEGLNFYIDNNEKISLDETNSFTIFNINSSEEALEYAIFLYIDGIDSPMKPFIADKEYDDILEGEGKYCQILWSSPVKGARVQDGYIVEFNFYDMTSGNLQYVKIGIDSDGKYEVVESYVITNTCLGII